MWKVDCFFLFYQLFYFNSSFHFISDIRKIIKHDDSKTLEELLNQDSSISETRSEYNSTLLHYAAMYNSSSCIRVLLRFAPHHLDAVDKFNDTPLMDAVERHNIDAVKMMLRAGADVRAKNNDDHTVFNIACYHEMFEILNQHQQVSGIF